MAAMADFARLPTRQKVMVFLVIGGLLGALYWQFVYKGLVRDLTAAENENAQKKQLNKKLEADIPEFERLKADHARLKRIIDENQKALPTEAELPAFFETLNRKVLESGVEVIRSKQGKEEPIETFVKVPIEYEIQGTYAQIKKFFASLVPKKKKPGQEAASGDPAVEERERIVSIENFTLTSPTVRNREIRLTAKFVAVTYRQEDKAATAPAPAKGAPAPAAPAKPATNTPAGAKASTEQSLDKGAAKTGSATGVERMKEGK